MVREFIPAARCAVLAVLIATALAGCGIKGPLKAPANGGATPPVPPPGVELPSSSERRN